MGRLFRSESAESNLHADVAAGDGQPYDLTPAAASTDQFALAPPATAMLVRHPASTPLAECGSTTSSASDRGELAPETASTAIDAQSTMTRMVHARGTCQIQSPGTPHSCSHLMPVNTACTTAASAEVKSPDLGFASPSDNTRMPTAQPSGESTSQLITRDTSFPLLRWGSVGISLDGLPNEILMQILGFLDVSDLLTTSRVSLAYSCLYYVLFSKAPQNVRLRS